MAWHQLDLHLYTQLYRRRVSHSMFAYTQSCPWVGLTHGLGWVGRGSRIFWVGSGSMTWTHKQLCLYEFRMKYRRAVGKVNQIFETYS